MLLKSDYCDFRTYYKTFHEKFSLTDLIPAFRNYLSIKKEKRLYGGVSMIDTLAAPQILYTYINNLLDMCGKQSYSPVFGVSPVFEMRELAKKLAEDNYENDLDRQIDKDTLFDWLKEYVDKIW